MWRITEAVKTLGRWALVVGRAIEAARHWLAARAGAVLEWAGDRWLEVAAGCWLLIVLGYGRFGPSDVRLCRVGDTVVTAPAWVVALIVSLVFAIVFALVVSQIEDE